MDRRPKVPRAAMVGPTVARGVAAWLAPLGRCARGVRQPRPARMPVALARATGFGRITRLHPLDTGGHAAGLHHPAPRGARLTPSGPGSAMQGRHSRSNGRHDYGHSDHSGGGHGTGWTGPRLHPLDIGGHAAGLHHPELEGRESRHQDRGQRRNAGVAAETADTTMVIVTIPAADMVPGGPARAAVFGCRRPCSVRLGRSPHARNPACPRGAVVVRAVRVAARPGRTARCYR